MITTQYRCAISVVRAVGFLSSHTMCFMWRRVLKRNWKFWLCEQRQL